MTTASKILVVDDEPKIRRFLEIGLAAQNYISVEASNAEEAIAAAASETPDLIILDLGLPDRDGLEVIKVIRAWSQIPIIVLSVRTSEADKVAALDNGADDYITKPFGIGELLARVRTALRHGVSVESTDPEFVLGALKVDFVRRLVTVSDNEVHLSRKEYDILRTMISHAGRVLTHQHILREVWGENYVEETQYLRVYIGQLRQKIERDAAQPEYIVTEPGVGYRLKVNS